MTIEATIDTEFDTEIDPVWEKRVDRDEASEHDLATRLVDPECPFSGPSAGASSGGN
jgi:hypothetical protein